MEFKMKKIKVEKDKKTGDHYLNLEDFKSFVDIDTVKYYKLEPVHDLDNGVCLMLSFYDKDNNLINVNETNE